MPQGWDFGGTVGVGGVNIFSTEIQPELVCELLTSMAHATAQYLGSPLPFGLGEGPKVKYH